MTRSIAHFLPVFTPTALADFRPSRSAPPPMTMPDLPDLSDGDMPDIDMSDLGMSDMSALGGDLSDMDASGLDQAEAGFLDDNLASSGDDEGRRIAQARDDALAEAAVATEAALAVQGAELEARFAETLVEERRRWSEQESAVMAEQLRNGLAALEKVLAEGVVEILQPFLERAVRAQAAEELRQAVTQLIATPDTALIKIGGPADLVEPLRAAFTDEAAIEITASDAPEVTIEAGDTLIRTQLQSWATTLDGHLGEAN